MLEAVAVVIVLFSVVMFVTIIGDADSSVSVRSLRSNHLQGPAHPRLLDIVR